MKKGARLAVLIAAVLAATATQAYASFGKVSAYKDGQFSDVKSDSWYAKEVASAFELGFMNGKSGTLFSPEGTMTVAEGVTIAARLNSINSGKEIAKTSSAEWYDMYVDYAKANGIIKDGQFNSYKRNLRRYEMAQLIASSLPESFFTAQNNISEIPDVNSGEEYFDDLLMLYKAGIVLGSDKYGNFHPASSIKRCEVAAIVNRTAIPENRLHGELAAPEKYNEAYYLIYNKELNHTTRKVTSLSSGWNYEDRFSEGVNAVGSTTNALNDYSDKGYVAINRKFEKQTDGMLTLETKISLTSGENGARMYIENSEKKNVFEIYTKDGSFHVKAKEDIKTDAAAADGEHRIKVCFDLDKKLGTVSFEGVKTCDFTLGDFGDFSKIVYSTTPADILSYIPTSCMLYTNYLVNENFACANVPYDWSETSAKPTALQSDTFDSSSLKFESDGSTSKKFTAANGKVVFETYVYMPGKDSAYVSMNGLRVDFNGDKMAAGNYSRTFKNDVWQCVHIEADTAAHTAVLFVNGKRVSELAFSEDKFDTVTLGFNKKTADGCVWFDDVKVYNIYDYADYCPAPQKAESDDYTLIMSVCSLWREGNHSGWDFVSPYDECTPLLGYYDEGIPEEADWEIKQLAEHGIDAMQYCWYTPLKRDFDAPIKNPKYSEALHDGYFYAKYSDYVKYCILWENAYSVSNSMTLESFKSYVWDYWLEWYLTDSRSLVVDNKPVIQMLEFSDFKKAFGSLTACRKVVDFMNTDIKKYGYDGIILLFSDGGQNTSVLSEMDSVGADGIATYTWGTNSYDPEYLKSVNETGIKNVDNSSYTMFYVPTVATGLNIMGWENRRSPLATVEQHAEVMECYKDLLKKQNKTDMVYFSTWNEFGEGHWLAPSGLNGYGYADVWRKAFTNAPEVHDDVTPTINQKNRICHLYNVGRTPIRAWLEVDTSAADVPQNTVKSWDFKNDKTAMTGWAAERTKKPLEIVNGAMRFEAALTDSFFFSPDELKISADKADVIHVRLKSDIVSSPIIFFTTTDDKQWNAQKSVSTLLQNKGEYVDLYFNMRSNALWTGEIKNLRFDIFEEVSNCDIELIEILGYSQSQKDKAVTVDGIDLGISSAYITNDGTEYYVAALPLNGLYSACNFYYEWNRFKNKLYIKTGTDTEFEFTAGSDKALVNGSEKTLAKPFALFDHIPVLPMRFILDNAGIKYTASHGLNISVRGIDYKEIADSRVEGQWEFNIPGDVEGWTTLGIDNYYVAGGCLTMTAKPFAGAGTGYDPGISHADLNLVAKDYASVEIRIKIELRKNATDVVDKGTTIYFSTNKDGSLDEKKTLRAEFTSVTPDADGFVTLKYDTSSCAEWKDVINSIRFDPSNNNGKYTIDYIRFIKK